MEYESYCLDYLIPLHDLDQLVGDSGLGTVMDADDAARIDFILNMYKAGDAADPDLEAAAIQCAIWNITTGGVFLSNPVDGTHATYGNDIRNRAAEILASIPEPPVYPMSIELAPESQCIGIGESATLVATVLDQDGQPFEGANVSFMTTAGTLSVDWAITDVNGEAEVVLTLATGSATVTATVNAGESVLVWDGLYPTIDKQNLAVPPEEKSDCARVCVCPAGLTPGFWKNNIGKNWGWVNGRGIQVPLANLTAYLLSIDTAYGPTFPWLDFDPNTPLGRAEDAYAILSTPENSKSMMLKAQKHILALLLTIEWYDDNVGEGLYLDGCVDLPGDDDPTIGEALEDILAWYTAGNYAAAKNLADFINNQPSGGY
ncbi:MAG: hypothetical protein FJ151_00435 [Euryarchaeota archaeon]|nr:hypothetical protein [Euryarchaeota archaeon]